MALPHGAVGWSAMCGSQCLPLCLCKGDIYRCSYCIKKQNLRRRFGASKMHLSPPPAYAAVCSKAVVLLLLTFCLLLLPLSILVLQSS